MNKHTPQQNDFRPGGPSVLQYLNNSLSSKETRAIEERLSQDQMLVDAIEGLRQLDAAEAAKIDFQLKNYIKHKVINKGKTKKQPGFPSWLFMTIVILLLLISIGYFVITQLLS
ncbi:MAG: hypothetical protein RL152_1014 [Bacteroidota bacterium]